MISKERLQGNWTSIVDAIRKRFEGIQGDELKWVQGNAEQLIGLLQNRTGQSREQIEAFLSDCCQKGSDTINRLSSRASEVTGKAGEAVRDNYDNTLKSIARRPVESMAIALGAGVVAGLVVGLSMAARRR